VPERLALVATLDRAEPADAVDLSRLHALAFDRVWSPTEFSVFLEAGAVAYLARIEGVAVALGLFRPVADEAEVLTLATDPAHRGRGLAAAVLATAIQQLAAEGVRTMALEVAADNRSARALYARAGFREIGRRRAYYPRRDGAVDALVLALALDPGDES
jgi:ribosomal-protein-alanine N-acetyltransferase